MARTTRERAIDGLRMIAAAEEYVAAELGSCRGYYGRLARHLNLSAADRRAVASELAEDEDPMPPASRRLRLVRPGCDATSMEAS
jgi:hypothetical protein